VKARFPAPVLTGPGAHPASYTMYTGSLPGVKQPGRGVDHPSPSSAEDEERVELYIYSLTGTSWPVLVGEHNNILPRVSVKIRLLEKEY